MLERPPAALTWPRLARSTRRPRPVVAISLLAAMSVSACQHTDPLEALSRAPRLAANADDALALQVCRHDAQVCELAMQTLSPDQEAPRHAKREPAACTCPAPALASGDASKPAMSSAILRIPMDALKTSAWRPSAAVQSRLRLALKRALSVEIRVPVAVSTLSTLSAPACARMDQAKGESPWQRAALAVQTHLRQVPGWHAPTRVVLVPWQADTSAQNDALGAAPDSPTSSVELEFSFVDTVALSPS